MKNKIIFIALAALIAVQVYSALIAVAGNSDITIKMVDGTEKKVSGYESDSRLFIPLQAVCDNLNIKLSFSRLTRRIVLSFENAEAVMFAGMSDILFNDSKVVNLDEPCKIENGQIYMLPADAAVLLETILKFPVRWQPRSREIQLNPEATPDSASSAPAAVSAGSTLPGNPAVSRSPQRKLKIVVDPGHGGPDSGAVGRNHLKEKDVNLDIALRLAQLISRSRIAEAILTRTDDEFVSLNDRTKKANAIGADLFISIHANSGVRRAAGTEVYIYDINATNEKAAALAKDENADISENLADITRNSLVKKSYENASIELAGDVLSSIIKDTKLSGRSHQQILRAPFFVLHHSEMPAILLEVAFISNPREEALLRDPVFHNQAAEAIFSGIETYVNSISAQANEKR